MAHQIPGETLVNDTEQEPAGAAATGLPADVQALIDAELAAFAKANGLPVPTASGPQTTALEAIGNLATDAAHTSFAQKLEHLAGNGYQAVVDAEKESPLLRTLITVVGEIAAKVA